VGIDLTTFPYSDRGPGNFDIHFHIEMKTFIFAIQCPFLDIGFLTSSKRRLRCEHAGFASIRDCAHPFYSNLVVQPPFSQLFCPRRLRDCLYIDMSVAGRPNGLIPYFTAAAQHVGQRLVAKLVVRYVVRSRSVVCSHTRGT
jgi:hypothetical protein